ncbi:chemotaxis protein methyltransferase CheR [Caldanaerobius fijiensis DSM 17918]|uniref:protein-glutamate O-methyltransferase n=1 Tax=Caldanaerobius fijiensis DSM 17918 TaxID=1121256 RepID=A0A1M4UE28_9THEO|nr:chemotaxis protein methyltransferase CheR [Caldanaerobius fijiensis DSM 17918]
MLYREFIKEILEIAGLDLSAYKENQMMRRIKTLMTRHNLNEYSDYLTLLRNNKDAYNEFIDYITINVSEFFRNPQQWSILENDIIPIISKKRFIKVWSAACSNGEEPYSISLLLRKYIDPKRFTIIASDIDENALKKAKAGIYNAKSIENVPTEFMKYFDSKNGMYAIKEEIKENVSFVKHDLILDEYFSDIDLLLCRNVVIYFNEDTKEMVFYKLAKALNPGGILFVGSTEQIFMPKRFGLEQFKSFFYKKVE